MVSRFAQIVNAFSRRIGEQSFLRCRQHDRHDTRHFVHFPYFEKYDPISCETRHPKVSHISRMYKLSDVSLSFSLASSGHAAV